MAVKQHSSVSAHTIILTVFFTIIYLDSGLLMAWLLGGASSLNTTKHLMAAWVLPLVVMALGYCLVVMKMRSQSAMELWVPILTSTLQKLKLQAKSTAQLTAATAFHMATSSSKAVAAFTASVLSVDTLLMFVGATASALGVAIGLWVSVPVLVAYYRRAAKQALSPPASKLLSRFRSVVENTLAAGIICYLIIAFFVDLAAPKVNAAFCLVCSVWRAIQTAVGAVKAWAVALKNAVLRVMCKLVTGCRSMVALVKRTTAALHTCACKLVGCAMRSLDAVDAALGWMEKVCSSCTVADTATEQRTTPADQQCSVEKVVDTSDADVESEADSSAEDVDTPPRTSLEEDLRCPAPAIGHGSSSSDSSSGDSC